MNQTDDHIEPVGHSDLREIDTEANLKSTSGRPLNANQQALANQVRAYMDQAKAALQVGDLQRGQNLARKAQLLSNELVRR